MYTLVARATGQDRDPSIRQALAQSHILGEVQRLNGERAKAVRAAGGDIPGLPNFTKLLTAHLLRHHRDLGLRLLGASRDAARLRRRATGVAGRCPRRLAAHMLTAGALQAQALPIFGGTDQIQRNIIGERALGLPKEPGDLSRLPWNDLPRNG